MPPYSLCRTANVILDWEVPSVCLERCIESMVYSSNILPNRQFRSNNDHIHIIKLCCLIVTHLILNRYKIIIMSYICCYFILERKERKEGTPFS